MYRSRLLLSFAFLPSLASEWGAVGIKWADFNGDVLHIQRRIYERKEGTPKTRSSDRFIPIPAALLERLHTLGKGEWIFRTKVGSA
jgi:hypothetical protein